MKKSEKIELRVDHMEKERLAKVAERRGQTISDVVRDALAGELGIPQKAYPKWPGVAAICALGLATCSLIWTGFGSQGKVSLDRSPAMSRLVLFAGTQWGAGPRNAVLQTQVPHRDGFSQNYKFKIGAQEFETNHAVEETGSGIYLLKMDICRTTNVACDSIDQAEIILSPPAAHPRGGQAKFFDGDKPAFYVDVLGGTIPKLVSPTQS